MSTQEHLNTEDQTPSTAIQSSSTHIPSITRDHRSSSLSSSQHSKTTSEDDASPITSTTPIPEDEDKVPPPKLTLPSEENHTYFIYLLRMVEFIDSADYFGNLLDMAGNFDTNFWYGHFNENLGFVSLYGLIAGMAFASYTLWSSIECEKIITENKNYTPKEGEPASPATPEHQKLSPRQNAIIIGDWLSKTNRTAPLFILAQTLSQFHNFPRYVLPIIQMVLMGIGGILATDSKHTNTQHMNYWNQTNRHRFLPAPPQSTGNSTNNPTPASPTTHTPS